MGRHAGVYQQPSSWHTQLSEGLLMVAFMILYFVFLTGVAGFAVLWSGWPEKRGGWLLAMKRKLPQVMQLWHPKQLIPFYILCFALLLLFNYVEYKLVKPLISQ